MYKNNKKQDWQIIGNFSSKVFGNVEVHKSEDGKMTSFKNDGSFYGLSIKDFAIKLSQVNDDKLIANTVRVFASFYDTNLYGKMVKNTVDNKEYSIEHFRNIVAKHNPNLSVVTNDHLMTLINDKTTEWILIDEVGSVNQPSTMDSLVIKDVTNTIQNNSFEGSNNVEQIKAFSDQEIIKWKAWYIDNKAIAKTYNITRDFNSEWNKNLRPDGALAKYRLCFDNEIANKTVSNQAQTINAVAQSNTNTNGLGLNI